MGTLWALPNPLSAPSTQTHGPLLRLHQVSPADSGEYVCHVVLGSEHKETSVLVTIEPSESIPGEWLPVIQKAVRGRNLPGSNVPIPPAAAWG